MKGRAIVTGALLALPVMSLRAEESGPLWRWKESSPGVTFTLKEKGRMKVSGDLMVFYSLESAGFPQGKQYALYLWNFGVSEGWVMMKGFSSDAGGRLTCESPVSPEAAEKDRSCPYDLDQLELRAKAGEKGVPFRAGIVSSDGQVKAFARAVPLPVDFKQNGCTLSAEVASEDFSDYLIQGNGYAPGETVEWTARTQGLSKSDKITASSNGKFVVEIHPGTSGVAAGKMEFSASGKSCSPMLIFKWGKK